MNQCAKACGDQADTADGFHAVQSDRNSVDGIGAAALTIGKGPLHQGAHHHAAFTRHQLTVEVDVGEGFNDDSAVVGDVAGAEYQGMSIHLFSWHFESERLDIFGFPAAFAIKFHVITMVILSG